MDALIIFGAKYLIAFSVAAALLVFLSTHRSMHKRLAALFCTALPLAYALGLLARSLYENPRPFISDNVTPLISHGADNGFPSDHMLLASTLAAIVTTYDRRLGAVLWIIAIVVGAARVAAGVHHPIDIVGSAAIAIVATGIVHYAFYHWARIRSRS